VSLIEAQAAGKAVVSTRTGGIENVVLEGRTGLLSPVRRQRHSPPTCCAPWRTTACATDGRCRLGPCARRYHYTRLVHETADLYTALLA
jgi:hypothetical protein